MSDRLSALDAAFLNLEQPHAPMHVAGLYIFKAQPQIAGRPGLPGLFDTVRERIHLVPRYRQVARPVPFGLGHPVWVDDPNFDLAYHLRRAALPKPGGRKELLDYVARIHARPLDRRRPLWEMYIIEGIRGGVIALYAKTHHAMVDGMSAVDIATLLLDFDPEGWKPTEVDSFDPAPLPGGRELVAQVAREAGGSMFSLLSRAVANPSRLPALVTPTAVKLSALPRMMSLLRPVPKSPINGRVGPNRRIELVPIALERAKAIKNALGGTVNDVVLAAVAEALYVFLEHRGEPTDDLAYRVMVPVSVRDDSQRMTLGNRVSGIFVNLPVGRMPARRRLQQIQAETSDLKERQQAVDASSLVDITSWAPATLHSLAGQLEFTNQRFINLVVSNVPGMQVPVYVGGAPLLEAYPLLPVASNLALVVCVTSYNGGMYFGLVADYDVLPDLEVLATGLRGAFEKLERAAAPARRPRPTSPRKRGEKTTSTRKRSAAASA